MKYVGVLRISNLVTANCKVLFSTFNKIAFTSRLWLTEIGFAMNEFNSIRHSIRSARIELNEIHMLETCAAKYYTR